MSAATTTGARAACVSTVPALAHLARLRVAGVLSVDAALVRTTGRHGHALLMLQFASAHGLPYAARVDLGDDMADEMAAEALLPAMRRGAFVSVAGTALELRHDHGSACLRVLDARDVVLFTDPLPGAVPAAPPNHPTLERAAHVC